MAKQTAKSGQIVLLLAFLLAGLVFLFILNADIFLAIRNKTRLRNAGDAAALAAARWQGVTLNLIGDLNLCRLAAACDARAHADTVDDIVALQERLALAGPLVGFFAANETARRNGAPPDPEMAALVDAVRQNAFARTSPAWPEKGTDYAAMLSAVLAGGLAAGADNARILPAVDGDHPLYARTFYQAVDAAYDYRHICLNLFGGDHAAAAAALQRWSGWGDVPAGHVGHNILNSEFFGVGVAYGTFPPGADGDPHLVQPLLDLARAANLHATVTADAIRERRALTGSPRPWFCFDLADWHPWHALDTGSETRFPLLAPVKDAFDVAGAMAACRVRDVLVPLAATSATNAFAWTAAARPFGAYGDRRVTDVVPDVPLVLPLFSFVRLIPLGGVGDARLGAADKDWVDHLRQHIPEGLRPATCRFCATLAAWDANARSVGETFAHIPHEELCCPDTMPGGPGGGTSHAH